MEKFIHTNEILSKENFQNNRKVVINMRHIVKYNEIEIESLKFTEVLLINGQSIIVYSPIDKFI